MTKYNIREIKEKSAVYRTLVSQDIMDELEQKILRVIKDEKKYRDKDYSAKQLAADLNTNTRYISAVVNVRFRMNYTALVNKFRIADAMRLLVDPSFAAMKMEDVSDAVGFSNRQSFYAAFYRIAKMTPREYRKQHIKPAAAAKEAEQSEPGTRKRKTKKEAKEA